MRSPAALLTRCSAALSPVVCGALMLSSALITGADLTSALVALAQPWGWFSAACVLASALCKRAHRANRQSVRAILARVEADEASPASALSAAD